MKTKITLIAAFAVCFGSGAIAQTATTPFHILGPIQSFTLNTTCGAINPLLCGGTMKVNGITVTLPAHTIIWFPATFLTPNDVFRWQGPDSTKPVFADHPALSAFPLRPASGLALEDPTPPVAAFEADLTGNIQPAVGGTPATYVAGLVKISQQALNTTDGYILAINTATTGPTAGELTVGPQGSTLGAADPAAVKVRLNDPEGRFGLKRNSYDWRFAVDDENATVRSATGYPMCIPIGTADVECPATNRPAGAGGTLLSRFTMGPVDAMNFLAPGAAAGPGVAPAPSCPIPTCNPNKQVPFAVGDRITFAGTLAKDAVSGARYISAHTIIGWLGIYTEPLASQLAGGRNTPAYLAIDVSLLATGGVPFTGVGQENGPGGGIGATRIKMEIVTTDPTRAVAAFAVDFTTPPGGPSRVSTPRSLAITAAAAAAARAKKNAVVPSMTFAPAAKPPFGRLRLVVDRANFLPPTRELLVRFVGSTRILTPTTARGALANEYKAPLGEFIFPENLIYGQPAVPANFENLCFLLTGIGPLDTLGRVNPSLGVATGPLVGPLVPFPSSGRLTPQSPCAP